MDKLLPQGVIRPTVYPRTSSHGCQIVQWDYLNAKNIDLKISQFGFICESTCVSKE